MTRKCPVCGSWNVDYRVRTHDFRCKECRAITPKNGIVLVTKEQAFSKYGAAPVSSHVCHRNRGTFTYETNLEEALERAGLA